MTVSGEDSARSGSLGEDVIRDERVLVLAPYGGDAPLLHRILSRAGLDVQECGDPADLCREIRAGAAAALLAGETLTGESVAKLCDILEQEPSWSDFPLLIMTSGSKEANPWELGQRIRGTSYLIFLERPLRTAVLTSAVRTAVQARRRQYQVRDELMARRRAEEDLRKSVVTSRRQFAEIDAIYRSAHVGLCVLDWQGRFVRINDRMAEMNGLPASEHLGKTPGEVVPEIGKAAESLLTQVLSTGEPILNVEIHGKTPARSGEERTWIEHWLPLEDEDGQVTRVSVVAQEITERMRREEELRRLNRELNRLNEELEERVRERTANLAESEARYRGLVENTLDIPFSLAPDGRIRYVGPQAKRYAFEPEEVEGRHFFQFVHPEDRRRVVAGFRMMVEKGENLPLDFRVRTPDGDVRWLEQRGLLVKDGYGQVTGITGVLRDVTERKRVEVLQARQRQQLRHLAARLASAQDEEQRRIAQGLHDDVAQLLTACSVQLALAERATDSGRRRAVHDEIDGLLAEATEKIRSLSFDLYSSALHRLGLEKALEELCQDMSNRYGMTFRMASHGETGDLDGSVEIVLFKGARELLFNVVKHAGVEEAALSLIREHDSLSLTVEDSGVGFPEAPEEEHVDLGKGVGLFGVRERMLELGGGMRIETAPGEGSRVTLYLPLWDTGAGRLREGSVE